MMFVNLPIENLKRSVDFYTALGFEFNPQFTSEDSTCMLVNENCFVMLLEKQRFAEFVDKEIADNTKTVSALFALSLKVPMQCRNFVKRPSLSALARPASHKIWALCFRGPSKT